jgi:Gamma-glutamyl phosphate reductase
MLDTKDINIYIDSLGASAKKASSILAQAPEKQKNDALLNIAKIIDLKRNDILDQNVKDLEDAKNKQIGDALVDRLE